MSKKKKNKKHKFKHSAASVNPAVASTDQLGISATPAAAAAVVRPVQRRGDNVLDLTHVASDIRKVIVLAVGFIILQFVLWYLFEHTPLGADVYGLFKL